MPFQCAFLKGDVGFYEPAAKSEFDRLIRGSTASRHLMDFEPAIGDRSLSDDPAIRYFSGTLTYRTHFDFPAEVEYAEIWLYPVGDQVASVRVNGKPAGTIWCKQCRVDLPVEALKRGDNELEIDVTNSWRNRLIGDEQEPADCEFENAPYGSGQFLVRYPDWFKDGIGARPSKGRKCFTTWNYFTKDSKLSPSGLIVPPTLVWREK